MPRRNEYYKKQDDSKFQPYHDTYLFLRTKSYVISPGNAVSDPSKVDTFKSVSSMKFALNQILEERKATEERLTSIETQFRIWFDEKINKGYFTPDKKLSDTEMPGILHEKKLKLEAKIDVIDEEVKILNKRIDEFVEVDDQDFWERGLLNHRWLNCTMYGSNAVDGQKLGAIKNVPGLIIVEKASPFYGMHLSDYRRMCEQHREDRKKLNAEKRKMILAKQANDPHAPPPFGWVIGNLKKEDLPEFPSWAKNYLKDKKVKVV